MLIGYVSMDGENFLDNFHQLFELINQNIQRKKQKRDWYHRNKEAVLEQQKSSENKKKSQKEWYKKNKEKCITRAKMWNKENSGARKLIVERHKHRKGSSCQWTSTNPK